MHHASIASCRRAAALLAATLAISAPAAAQTQASCTEWLAQTPLPSSLAPLSGPGAAQRAALLAAGGKLVAIGSRYYAVSVPAAFYTAGSPVVVFDLHGTGGYAEAEWNDWGAAMSAKGHAFVALSWGGGTPSAESDATVYSQLQQIAAELGRHCPTAGARKWLMGFSVGSAVSFAVMVRDTAGARLFRGQLAVSGSAIGPLTTGMTVMHATVEAARSDPAALRDVLSWMYCGVQDTDHGWSMCTEMPLAKAFVDEHGGSATLYEDANGRHHSLPGNTAAREAMFAFIAAAPGRTFLSDTETDCLLSWAELQFPALLWPRPVASLSAAPYRYRLYSGSGWAAGVSSADGRLYALLPGESSLRDLGAAGPYADQARCR